MQWLTLVPEDSTIQRLQSDYRRPSLTRVVDTLSPCAPGHRADRRRSDTSIEQLPAAQTRIDLYA